MKKILIIIMFFFGCVIKPSITPYEKYFFKGNKSAKKNVTATFLGTTTILISDGKTSIMTDGFFTRPSMWDLSIGKIEPDTQKIHYALEKANITNLKAVIPVHSHHDHAMDAPEVAKKTGAILVGSNSTANIGLGYGLSEKQILVPKYGEKIKFGDFFITLLLSEHLPLSPFITMLTGHEKHISEPLSTPAKIYDYKEGDSFAILIEHPNGNILINGSAGYKKGLLNDVKADVVFLGIAGISYQNDKYKDEYYFEVIERVSPSLIIPIHWDDFTVDYNKGLHPPNKLIDDFSSNLDYLISKTSKDSSKEIILLPMWGKIGLF